MRKYSPVIGLLAVITAMAILQLGTLNADASSATISSQSNQIHTPSMGDQDQISPIEHPPRQGRRRRQKR